MIKEKKLLFSLTKKDFEVQTFFAAMLYDTDGFSYVTLGIYNTRPLADERCLKYSEEHKLDLSNFSVEEKHIDEDWK